MDVWNQEINLSKATNQKFVSIPYDLFIDGEEPVKANYDKSRRKYRGLFLSNQGIKINADVNGSYQIMKKVFPNSFEDGVEGAGCHPLSMKIT